MPKYLYCAECGYGLLMNRKVLRGEIVEVVEPHNCIYEDKCKYYPMPWEKTNICHAGNDISGEFVCNSEFARTCRWCIEEKEKTINNKKERPANVDDLFDSFKFVKTINDLKPKPSIIEDESSTGDRRSKENLRQEIPSSAPTGVLDIIGNSKPVSKPTVPLNMEEFEDGD